ncbi:MAG: hypothetical protein IK051_02615 [Rhodocyclaceae bacterium]|nr:hypothetical protein [Rhodocyclaceae bacterium]
MNISTLGSQLNNQAALSALTMGTQASRNKGKQGNDPMRALSGAIALQGGEEDGAMTQRLQQMKESVQALGGTQNSKEARKQAAIKKVEQLSQRAEQLKQMLQKGSPITGTFAKNTAQELKSIAKQLAAAVKDIRAAKDEGGAEGGGADLSAQVSATAQAAESAASAAGADAEQAESGAEQAASDAESSASQAEQQASRAAERAAETSATGAEQAATDAVAAGTDAAARAQSSSSANGEDDFDKKLERMIELTKMSIRHAAGLLKARLKDQHSKEAKDCDEAIQTLQKMDDDRMAESATYDSTGGLRDLNSLGSLGLSVQV